MFVVCKKEKKENFEKVETMVICLIWGRSWVIWNDIRIFNGDGMMGKWRV